MRSKKAFYNIVTNLLFELIVIINGFIVPRIIIQKFGSDVNGLVTSISQFLSYIVLLESGFGPVVKSVLYKPIAKKNKEEIVNILACSERFFRKICKIFILYIILLALFYPLIVNNEFSYIYTFSLIIIISLSTIFEYFFGITYSLYLEAEQKSYVSFIIKMIAYIINIIVLLVFSRYINNVHLLKLIFGILFILKPIIQNIYVKKKYNLDFSNIDKKYNLKQKWDGLIHHIAYVIHSNTDIVLLTFFSNLHEVSVYSVYLLILKGIKSFIQSLCNGVSSIFGNMFANNEKENILIKFDMYEFLYYTIVTIVYACTYVLTIPFISVYTIGIVDINYIRPLFAFLIITGEFIWAIRLPHSTLVSTVGQFKQTKNFALVEAIVNITISVILVFKMGIIGVAIGTLIAILIRTLYLVYYTNKKVLDRSISLTTKKIFIMILNIIIIYATSILINLSFINSYFTWIIGAVIIFLVSCLVVLISAFIFDRKNIIKILKLIKKIILNKGK